MGKTQQLGTLVNGFAVDANGNVGIGGAASASYKLDVTGTIRATGSIFGDVGFRTKSLNGYLLKNDADNANLGGLTRRSYWAGGAALDTQIFAETGYGIFLNVNGSSSTGMVINSSGNVLIGSNANSADTSLLTIKQASTSFTNGIYLERGGERNGYFMYIGGALDALTFRRNYFGTQSDVMSLTRDGAVGIGTNNPQSLLDVRGATPFIRITDSSVTGETGIIMDASGGFIRGGLTINYGTGEYKSYCGIAGNSYFQTFHTNGSERMRISSNGNVGIGKTAPDYLLDLYGTGANTTRIRVTGTTNFSLLQTQNDSGALYIGMDSSTGGGFGYGNYTRLIWSTGAYPLIFSVNDSERMRITSGGELLLGSASSAWASSGRATFEVGGSGFTNAIVGLKMGASTGGYMYHNGTDMYINQDRTNRLYCIANSGGVYLNNGATSWTANSDERLKNINGYINDAVAKLMTLRAVNYTWKSDINNKENLGLIAQDVEQVFPQVIDKGVLPNTPTNPIDDTTEYLGVRYQELVPVLVKAIQELKAEIDILNNK